MDAISSLADWLEEDLPARFAEMLDTVLPLIPEQEQQGKEDDDHDDRRQQDRVVPAGTGGHAQGQAEPPA
jgi:hypothetical protein